MVMKRMMVSILCLSILGGAVLSGCRQQNGESVPNTTQGYDTGKAERKAHTTKSASQIIHTRYPASDIVIADIIATNPPYDADPNGEHDSTRAIQNAIDDCSKMGGGTVFLPVGKYKVSSSITIKPFVTLRGDWQDPDTGTDYGTIILADVKSTNEELPALFTIGGSAGAYGLTVYYPQQDIDDIKPYPYTFYIPGGAAGGAYYMLQSIINCTVINGYRGIGANTFTGVHEMMNIENFKGTFLNVGATAYNQADVGTWKNVVLSPKYWAEAGSGLKGADRSAIEKYTGENGTGLILGDLEWTQFANIKISHYNTGIHLVKGKRIEFAGSFFDLTVDQCKTGIRIDAIDERWGTVIAKSVINGSEKSIINHTGGAVKLAGTVLHGPTEGKHILQGAETIELDHIAYDKKPPMPAAVLYDAVHDYHADRSGQSSSSDAIQQALDDAAATGGVVYLPAGFYKLDKPLSVPAGVELRGSSPVPNRDQTELSAGTLLMAYYGDSSKAPEADTALITLNGDRAGISGLRVVYPLNGPNPSDAKGKVKPYTYTLRGKGDSVYAVNLTLVNSYHGIDFTNCNHHIIKRVVGTYYKKGFYVKESTGGWIEGCLQNGTPITRVALRGKFSEFNSWLTEDKIFSHLLNPITRKNTEMIVLDQAENQTVLNCFGYGVKIFLKSKDSNHVNVINVGADNLHESGYQLDIAGGNMKVVNALRYNGKSYRNNSGNKADLKIFNRLTINKKDEEDVNDF